MLLISSPTPLSCSPSLRLSCGPLSRSPPRHPYIIPRSPSPPRLALPASLPISAPHHSLSESCRVPLLSIAYFSARSPVPKMAHAPKWTKRNNTFHEDTEEPDHRRSQQATSRLRAAKERLQRLQQKAAAVREIEATLSKKVKETEESLIQEAVSQLRDGRKPQSLKWERLVALTAKWRYANDDQSIGSCALLKRSLSFAASLRLARHVTWSQWRAVENDPQHIEEVLSLCSQGCQQELDVDWGPYRFCLARQLPELVRSFLLGT